MTYATNPLYQEAHKSGDISFYIHSQPTELHASRFVEMNNQMIFASNGADKEFLTLVTDEVIRLVNDTTNTTFRTDVGTLMNNLKYRLKYPVDEQCSIRMGAMLCFIEGEPEMYNPAYQVKKYDMAMSDPDVYTFFLTWGISNIQSYREHLATLNALDYFRQRNEALRMLTPTNLKTSGTK